MIQNKCFVSITTSLVFISLLGCSGGLETVPVSGTVTLDGGPMPGEGTVNFLPIEPAKGFAMRRGEGEFGPDGSFRVKSFKEGEGLLPGKYRVGVHCWKVKPSMDGPPAVSYVPAKYMNSQSSGFELTVEPGSSQLTFDVPLKSDMR